MTERPLPTVEDLIEEFVEEFDVHLDAGLTLSVLVRAAGDYLTEIVGADVAGEAMMAIARDINPGADDIGDWRKAIEDADLACHAHWPLGDELHGLTFYALKGVLPSIDRADDPAAELERLVKKAARFLQMTPLQWIEGERPSPLEHVIILARNRWALDNHQPVEPPALAALAGVSEGRVRNLMSDRNGPFVRTEGGLIEASSALRWLANRPEYYPSRWREQTLPPDPQRQSAPLGEPVFVPVARDGSVFHPGLRRAGTFTVGPKGEEAHYEAFEPALCALQRMPQPFWRRPNENGSWGIVRGLRWERLDRQDLEECARNPLWRLRPIT